MSVFAYIKPCSLDIDFERAISSKLPEKMLRFSAPLEKAFDEIKEWSKNIGGSCLSSFGAQILIEIPTNKIADLTNFVKKYEYTAKVNLAVGIGMNTLEAYKAMLASEAKDGSEIVLYSEDLDNNLNKSESLDSQWDVDFPNLELDKTDDPVVSQNSDTNSQTPAEPPEKQSAKQKVVETLMLVKEKANVIAQLKQIDPKAYEAVKKIVDAMITMAHGQMQKSEETSEFTSEGTSEGTSEETSESSKLEKEQLVGEIVDGKIKVDAKDPVTGENVGQHTHLVNSGMVLGPTGHPASATQPDKE